jgi:hypothetical protein
VDEGSIRRKGKCKKERIRTMNKRRQCKCEEKNNLEKSGMTREKKNDRNYDKREGKSEKWKTSEEERM